MQPHALDWCAEQAAGGTQHFVRNAPGGRALSFLIVVTPPLDSTHTMSASGNTERGESRGALEVMRIGRYIVRAELGRGGMGVVYLAHDPELARPVAIKLVHPHGDRRWTAIRALAEARAMAKLWHPNVIPVFDVGTVDDTVYLVMPLIGGGTLRDWLRAAPRGWREITDRFLAAGRGLAAAHDAGIVHRDFKPQNVLLEKDGHAFVADFGLARPIVPTGELATTGVKGTPAYMAPEHLAGTRVDARTDQFSFCVSFWEGLRGCRPLGQAATAATHARERATDAPEWLLDILAKGFNEDRRKRWPSMRALLDEIARELGKPDAAPRTNRWRLYVVGGLALAATIAVPATIVATGGDQRAIPAAEGAAPSQPIAAAVPIVDARDARTLTHFRVCTRHPVFLDEDTIIFEVPGPYGSNVMSTSLDGHRIDLLNESAVDVSPDGSDSVVGNDSYTTLGSPAGGRQSQEMVAISRIMGVGEAQIAAFDVHTPMKRTVYDAPNATGVVAIDGELYYVDRQGADLIPLRLGNVPPVRRFGAGELGGVAFSARSRLFAHVHRDVGPVCYRRLSDSTSRCANRTFPTQTPAFSANGEDIFVGDAEGVWRIESVTGRETLVVAANATDGVTVSPDGAHLVWAGCQRGVGELSVIDLDAAN